MTGRNHITELLNRLEEDLKALEISYEQYFLGIEKRAPDLQRQKLERLFRQMLTKYIPQTDLKFRLRGLTSRFHSYAGYWDRILRLIDEGRYERHVSRLKRAVPASPAAAAAAAGSTADPLDDLYRKIAAAHESCSLKVPSRQQVADFIARQQGMLGEKFAGRQVEFDVVVDGARPKIKVRAKN
ncbi:MAG: hypothetical protein RQ723_00155 [Desulfuromonadales bacterium]|nr:hypothetical protein [Desulfuromonadales bacterium]